MGWSSIIASDDVVAIHAALVPTANGDGEIILFGGDNHSQDGARLFEQRGVYPEIDHTRRFNCRHPNQPLVYVHTPPFDVFCCGHAFLGDGRLLVAGGTAAFPDDAGGIHQHIHFEGHRHCATYNPASGAFVNVVDMGAQPGHGNAGGGRWYPTLCTLGTGEVFLFQGHPKGDDTRHGNNTPERYRSLTNSWVSLPPIGDVSSDPILYPRLHLLSNGNVFVSSLIKGFNQNIQFNPWSGAVQEVSPLPDSAYHSYNSPSVLLPLVPGDQYRPRILLRGGQNAQMLDLGNPGSGWQSVPRNGTTANTPRFNGSATLLPTGDVLFTGGTVSANANDRTGVMEPEIYRTPLDRQNGVYTAGTGHWDTINEPATVVRNYHSTALLMPDGRVWTAGGNSATQPGTRPDDEEKKIEIFDPPYPAGARPTITTCPSFVAYGDTFTIGVPNADTIGSVVLMRCGSSTHAYNPDQRAVLLVKDITGKNALVAIAPPNGNVAPPGPYMLFVVDKDNRPCQYARFVRVGGLMSMFTNRSHFSFHEIEALLSGGVPGSVPNAFYVVLDGFSASDLTSTDRLFPPSVQFHFVDNNGVVPDVAADLIDTLYEAPAAPPYITQRITLAYRLQFASTAAFNGIPVGGQRDIQINVNWGASKTSGRIFVFQHEHVYAYDGDPPWLSVDVRVTRIQRHTLFAGIRDDDPITFIQAAINRLRSLPNDEFHPFLQLSTNLEASKLELSDRVNGIEIDNFAFAKVRFRAPVGISAEDVKVFFRLFTTTVTHFNYDETTIYRRVGNGANAVALEGLVGGEVASIPFFASARSANPQTQPDPTNVFSLHGGGAAEVVAYFGCWLDFNHNTPLRNKIRGRHQCLVAEIHYPPSPIPQGTTPTNNDQLSQRNLAIVESDNPGGASAHTVVHTFELKPVPAQTIPVLLTESIATAELAAFSRRPSLPDELFIRWNDLPRDAIATIYLPSIDIETLLTFTSLRPGMESLAAIDQHTVQCRLGDVTYLTLPGSGLTNLAGLFTIQLPPTVKLGNTYRVSVHQISGGDRSITGSFEITIPVSRSELLVHDAERELLVLRGIESSILPQNRWKPIFARYLDILSDRVRAFGGNPDKHEHPKDRGDHEKPDDNQFTLTVSGKVVCIHYTCFGDFQGFVIETCNGQQHDFTAQEQRIYTLIQEASQSRRLVTVKYTRTAPKRPHSISLGYS